MPTSPADVMRIAEVPSTRNDILLDAPVLPASASKTRDPTVLLEISEYGPLELASLTLGVAAPSRCNKLLGELVPTPTSPADVMRRRSCQVIAPPAVPIVGVLRNLIVP
jgi:hypothetical protein